LTRRRATILFAAFAAALVVLLFVGCVGLGGPTAAGTHRFQAIVDGTDVPVYDPPQFGAFLWRIPPDNPTGQYSPDGSWLYLVYGGPGSVSLASVGAQQRDGIVLVDLWLKAECQLSCTADESVQATRVRLEPPVDTQHPPSVEVNGQPVTMEPWLP
jgi:hypothetical protein